jgi:hypothetical protein
MARRQLISRLILMAILVPAIWLGLVLAAKWNAPPEPPREYYDGPPPPLNAVSTHVLETKSGQIDLAQLIAEKDWKTACVMEEFADPFNILRRDFNMTVTTTTRPMIDEEWKFHLWKIVVVKDALMSVYYLDNRRIGRVSKPSCLPLERAVLKFEPNEDRIFVELVDKESALD